MCVKDQEGNLKIKQMCGGMEEKGAQRRGVDRGRGRSTQLEELHFQKAEVIQSGRVF